jgi:hypothetical protein
MTTFAPSRAPARWAVVAAHLTPLVTLPSGLWRVGIAGGASMGVLYDGEPFHATGWEIAYVLGLSLVAEATALLTVGLVKPWSERAPRWMPLIGGRRVPPAPVVGVAALGALALQYIWTGTLLAFVTGRFDAAFTDPAWAVLFGVCYLPLLLWAPLHAAVTFDYWRRRRTPAAR